MRIQKWFTLLLTAVLTLSGTAFAAENDIHVVSREDGSGTRSAFVELVGVLDEDGDDAIFDEAEITNSTSVMLATIAGDKGAIGYVSMGSLSEDVRALSVDGVEAAVENILNGTYLIARPFVLCHTADISDAAQDFINFIFSLEGQAIVTEENYISIADETTASYAASGLSGSITIAGSTSVAPVMEKLAEAYMALNTDVEIEIQQSGSSAGIQSTEEGVCDIGMSSRALEDTELASGLVAIEMARDGIAVIVNPENEIMDLSMEEIRDIFLGSITSWSDLT